MNLHEYQSKTLLKSYQIDVPESHLVKSKIPNSIRLLLDKNETFVFKSQIHAGGRGKSGGVKLISNLKDAESFMSNQLGSRLVTYQNFTSRSTRQRNIDRRKNFNSKRALFFNSC
jgi:succinyl-CoA synthetase beta subunit